MDLDFSLISDLTIGSVALVPIIIGVVSLLKRLAVVKDEYAPYVAALLSVVGYVVVKVLEVYPAFLVYAEPVAYSVFIFVVVSGAYQLSKSRKV